MSEILKFNRGASEVTTESILMLNIFSFHEFINYKNSEITTKRQLLDSLIGEEDVVESIPVDSKSSQTLHVRD